MFWVWITVAVLAIVGLSVFAGKALSKTKGRVSAGRQDQITALKASGALRHRKSNRP
ncbi:MAG: hypothetical protein ACT4OF_08770 [Caulobacteraceae bacterium]